jgi:hypothetical protein
MAGSDLVKVNLEPLKRFQGLLAADLRAGGSGPIRAAIKQWGVRYRSAMQERFANSGDGDWPPLAASTIAGRRAGRGMKGTAGASRQTRAGAARRLRQQIATHQKQLNKTREAIRTATVRTSNKTRMARLQTIHTLSAKIDAKKIKAAALGTMAGISILRDTGTLFDALSPQFAGNPGALEDHIPFGVHVGYGGPGQHPKGRATVADIASFHQVGGGRLPRRMIIVPTPAATAEQMRQDMDRGIARAIIETGNAR